MKRDSLTNARQAWAPTIRRDVRLDEVCSLQTRLGDAMTLPRRFFLRLAAGAAGFPLSRISRAESWPTRPVHWIISFPPGGANDIVARIIGQKSVGQSGPAIRHREQGRRRR
jgi:hypothetical protein